VPVTVLPVKAEVDSGTWEAQLQAGQAQARRGASSFQAHLARLWRFFKNQGTNSLLVVKALACLEAQKGSSDPCLKKYLPSCQLGVRGF
jgi:hypothetical protein